MFRCSGRDASRVAEVTTRRNRAARSSRGGEGEAEKRNLGERERKRHLAKAIVDRCVQGTGRSSLSAEAGVSDEPFNKLHKKR